MEKRSRKGERTTLAKAASASAKPQGICKALSTLRCAAAAQGKAGRCCSCVRSCSRRAASLALGLARPPPAGGGMEKELHAGGITCTPCPGVDAAGGERRGEAYPAEGGCSTLTPQR